MAKKTTDSRFKIMKMGRNPMEEQGSCVLLKMAVLLKGSLVTNTQMICTMLTVFVTVLESHLIL